MKTIKISNKELCEYYGLIYNNVKHMKNYLKRLKTDYINNL